MYYAVGQYANLLERALSVTMSPAADSLFPATNLWDGRPATAAKHGSNAADPKITWDGAAFTPGAASSYTFNARAGERRKITSGGTSNVTLQNLRTLKYCTSGGAWQTASANILTGAGNVNYQVESLAICQEPTAQLKITQSAAVTLSDWPRWNAVVLFGHNLIPGLTVELRSSTDNFSGSNALEVTGAILNPAFYMIDAGGIDTRYGRVAFTGTNADIPWYAEVMPCWLETAVVGHRADGYELQYREQQIRNDGSWGVSNVYPIAPIWNRAIKLGFRANIAGELELRNELIWRGRGGLYPMAVVPVTTEPTVVYGRLTSSWTVRRLFTTLWETDLIVAEDGIVTPLA